MKPGTDLVRMPLLCTECKHQIANFIPDQGIAICECGKRFVIMNYELKPMPKGYKFDADKK